MSTAGFGCRIEPSMYLAVSVASNISSIKLDHVVQLFFLLSRVSLILLTLLLVILGTAGPAASACGTAGAGLG